MAVNGIVACNDYDTHEADSVPRFGRGRASGDLQRGPPRQKGRDTRNTRSATRQITPFLRFSSPGSLRSSSPFPLPSIVYKLSQHLPSLPVSPHKILPNSHSQIYQIMSSTDSLHTNPFSYSSRWLSDNVPASQLALIIRWPISIDDMHIDNAYVKFPMIANTNSPGERPRHSVSTFFTDRVLVYPVSDGYTNHSHIWGIRDPTQEIPSVP